MKTLLNEVLAAGGKQGPYTVQAIAKARVSVSGRAGLAGLLRETTTAVAGYRASGMES